MIPESHSRLKRWAEWTQAGSGFISLGVGRSIESKIMEGKGEILPGAPYTNSGKIYHDSVAVKTQTFIRTLGRQEKRLIHVFYLWPVDIAAEKAAQLKLPVRTMYDKLHGIHIQLEEWWRK